jgi:hypothetical protein
LELPVGVDTTRSAAVGEWPLFARSGHSRPPQLIQFDTHAPCEGLENVIDRRGFVALKSLQKNIVDRYRSPLSPLHDAILPSMLAIDFGLNTLPRSLT